MLRFIRMCKFDVFSKWPCDSLLLPRNHVFLCHWCAKVGQKLDIQIRFSYLIRCGESRWKVVPSSTAWMNALALKIRSLAGLSAHYLEAGTKCYYKASQLYWTRNWARKLLTKDWMIRSQVFLRTLCFQNNCTIMCLIFIPSNVLSYTLCMQHCLWWISFNLQTH